MQIIQARRQFLASAGSAAAAGIVGLYLSPSASQDKITRPT